MHWNQISRCDVEVQFEDIDAGGVVHHPNYLKYLERARCQAMREIGVPFENCLEQGVAFVVAEVHSKYLRPLRFGQRVSVLTQVAAFRTSSLKIFQKIVALPEGTNSWAPTLSATAFFAAHAENYFQAQLRLVTISLGTGKPMPIPKNILSAGGFPSDPVLQSNRQWTDVRLERE